MLGLIAGAILTSIIMWFCQWCRIIPNQWDWFFFFQGIFICGRLFCFLHKGNLDNLMNGFILKFREENIIDFNKKEEQILKATAGTILSPALYISHFVQTEAASLNTWVGIGSIVLLGTSIYFQRYYSVVIDLILIMTGSKPWQPSPFYLGNEEGDLLNAVALIAKSEGRSVKDYNMPLTGKMQLETDVMSFTSIRDKFYNALDIYRLRRLDEGEAYKQ